MRDTVKILAAILGITTFFIGLIAGITYLILPLLLPIADARQANTMLVAVAAPGITLGFGLAREALGALDRRPSDRAHLPPLMVLFLLFVSVLWLGPSVSSASLLGAYVFPLLIILGIALPLLMIVRIVVHPTATVVNRELILQFTYGSLIATTLAVLIEGMALSGLVVVILGSVALLPGGDVWLSSLATSAVDPTSLQDTIKFQSLFLTPPVLAVVLTGGVLIAPLIEELIKVLGVVAMAYRKPSRAQAFAWGIVAGAGFAFTEGLLGGMMIPTEWPQNVLSRLGASMLHATATGIVALGWFESATHRRVWALPLAYFAAVGIHGWWNALGISAIVVAAAGTANQLSGSITTSITVGLAMFLVLTGLAILVLFGAFTRWMTTGETALHLPDSHYDREEEL